MDTCKAPNCTSTKIKARGLCSKHYERLRAHGDITAVRAAKTDCDVEGCTRPHRARGFCATHLARVNSNGSPLKVQVVYDGIKSNPLWNTWAQIKQRCLNPNNNNYSKYGGRGIGMHEPWINDSRAFIRWIEENLGPRPPAQTLDRIDNDGDYEPGNLRWSDWSTQLKNRRPRHDRH